MATKTRRISILRPLIIIVSALGLALILERFSLPVIPFTLSANNTQFRVVYSELVGSESTLWTADPTEPQVNRRSILTISHAYGYGVVASVSPDGTKIAYGFLPESRRDAFADGQLWVAGMNGQGSRLISGKMDLHFAPVWSPDGKRLLFKTVENLPSDYSSEIPAIEPGKPEQRPLDLDVKSSLMVASVDGPPAPKPIVSLKEQDTYPIGWSQDGKSAYFYTVEAVGSQAHQVNVATSVTQSLGQLASGTAWQVKLSPDRRKLLYLTVQPGQSGLLGTAWVFDPDQGQASGVSAPQLGPIGAIWHPSGNTITRNSGQSPSRPAQSLLDTTIADGTSQTLKENLDATLSIPISWSPDSTFLAVRQRSVVASDQLNDLAIFDTRSGQTKEIKGSYAEFVGWTTTAR